MRAQFNVFLLNEIYEYGRDGVCSGTLHEKRYRSAGVFLFEGMEKRDITFSRTELSGNRMRP